MKRNVWFRLLLACMLASTLAMFGCSGDDGSAGAPGLSAYEIAVQNGFTGTQEEWLLQTQGVEAESCSICHNGTIVRSGASHQAAYDELFQQGIVVASNVSYTNDGTNDIVTFDMTKNGVAFDCTQADSVSIVFAEYIAGTDTFELGAGGFNYGIVGTLSNAGGTCTSTKAQGAKGDLSALDGIVIVYGFDELVTADPVAHLNLAKYPFAAIQELGTVAYASAANVTGCENCHTTPYYKHGYITGDVSAGGGLDFWTCKACHLDDLNGGHPDWQKMVDDPTGWATGGPDIGDYTYKKNLMNDVHMSHAMEFPYPQSMVNCNTCHAGKLTQTLADANFRLEVCRSCHPVTGGTDTADANGDFAIDTRPLALYTLAPGAGSLADHSGFDFYDNTTACSGCHVTGNPFNAPVFSDLHTGYNSEIYDVATGTKYANAVTVTIDSVSQNALDPNLIDIAFSATGSAGSVNAIDIVPSVYVGAYGYDTKDFIVSGHNRDADRNRIGEYTFGDTSPYFSNAVDGTGTTGTWSVSFDTSVFDADGFITDGVVRRLEVAVAPTATDTSGQTVGLDAPSVTYNLTTGAIEPDYYQGANALVAETNCNSCHDQLATTFHSGNRGGNIVVCRMCHVVTSGGSHLAGQSRSIDSYAHAIHSFQKFDVDEIDFTDPVEVAHYEEHINFLFPDFATVNCEACHVTPATPAEAVYNVPDQSKSMPGLLSRVDEVPGGPSINAPEVVTGPAARACGGCHRAAFINEDDAGGFAAFNSHTKNFGYRVENDADDNTLYAIIAYIMGMFE